MTISTNTRRAVLSLAMLALAGVALAGVALAGCDADEPASRTEALDETAPAELAPTEVPEVIAPPAHAALPTWVPTSLRASIDDSRLPVMLPREPAVSAADLATGTVLHMDRWVSTRIETSTYIATIFGTDAHHEPPRGARADLPDPDRTVRGAPAYAYENEGLYYAQWSEDGIAWEVELECLGACDGVGLATRIAESLEAVGGVR